LPAQKIETKVESSMDSLFKTVPILNSEVRIGSISKEKPFINKTFDWYVFVFVVMLLGIIRWVDVGRFSQTLNQSIRPTTDFRRGKDQSQGNLSGFLLNIFF